MTNYNCGCKSPHQAFGLCKNHYGLLKYYENREKKIKQSKEWYRKNKLKTLAYKKKYRKLNPEVDRISCHKYCINHREELRLMRKKYRQTPNGKAATLRAIKRYELKNKERKKAWSKATNKYKSKISCEVCHKLPTHKHHPDIKYPLLIKYLCPLHHKQIHKDNLMV